MNARLPQSVIDDLPAIRHGLGGPRNLVIVDASRDPPVAVTAHFRAWLQGGVRLAALGDRAWRDADGWLEGDTKMVLVVQQGRPLPDGVAELIGGLDAASYTVVPIDPNTQAIVRLVEPSQDIVDQTYERAGQMSLELIGATSRKFERFVLPKKIRISARHADQFFAQFAIVGRGPDLPGGEPIWFRLDPGFEGTLSIDCDVSLRGDTWRLEIASDDSGAVKRLARTAPYLPDTGALEQLAVILDRTCPDNASWERALNLQQGALVTDWGDDVPELYNAEIRRALAAGLKTAFASGLVAQVQSWWFKDLPGEGLANFTGVELAGAEVGSGNRASREEDCDELFATAAYSPGLDLWDPAEVALEHACDALAGKDTKHRAILIVGNSPPSDPLQDDSALASLRVPPGARMACTVRRQSPGWHEALDRCAELRIPVCYLFLRHSKFGGAGQFRIEAYEQSQARVERVLAQTVRLESVLADPDSIANAVANAIRELRAQAGLASGVTLEGIK